jgi:hypothetical protein
MALKRQKGIKGKADREWSLRIRRRDPICRVCQRRPTKEAHHVIDRAHKSTRLLLMNGIGVCFLCHELLGSLRKSEKVVAYLTRNEQTTRSFSKNIGNNNTPNDNKPVREQSGWEFLTVDPAPYTVLMNQLLGKTIFTELLSMQKAPVRYDDAFVEDRMAEWDK